ncbi:MAG: glycosyltransferase family 4 protein [Pseudomonadota bacterium]
MSAQDTPPDEDVLLLSPFFAPEPISTGRYNAHLARGLVAAGHRVRVICSHPLYPDWVASQSDAQEVGMVIERGGAGLRYPRSNVPRRLVLELWYAWHTTRRLHERRTRAHRVILVLPPVLFALPLLLGKRRGQVIAVVHDLYGIMATSATGRSRRWVAALVGRIERAVLGRCDRLIALSSAMREAIVERYGVGRERIEVAYPFETLSELTASNSALAGEMPTAQRHVVYSGALGEKQMPGVLVEVFEQLAAAEADVVCHIFSAGPQFEALRRQPSHHERLRFHALVPEAQLLELYARSTLQVLPQAPGTGAGAFPSKLPNLIAAGVPVFSICDEDSEVAQVLREAEAGAWVAGVDAGEIAQAIQNYLGQLNDEPRDARRARLGAYVDQHFRVTGLLAKLSSMKS